MQNHYSLAYREEEREMNAYCNFAGIGIIPWGPLAAGKLARPYNAEATTRADATKSYPWYKPDEEWQGEIVNRVEKLAKEKGWTMAQVALAWIGDKVTSPIVGFSSVSHVAFRFSRMIRRKRRLSASKRLSFPVTNLLTKRSNCLRSRKSSVDYSNGLF
jgi:aryl-alcohol dehydrogenase-like predicted oxidoreductase